MSNLISRPACLLLACLTIGSAADATLPDGSFSFRDAEFMAADRGLEAAEAFVAANLPAGLPLADARRRLARAAMHCSGGGDGHAAIRCDFSEVVHIEGGTLGEDHWTVQLVGDGSDRLVSATLDHFVVGVGRPGL